MAAKSKVSSRLPLRRGLSACEAAIYLSLSASFFRRLVEQGIMPRPRIIGARRIWDVEELDIAFRALPREASEDTGATCNEDSWADFK
jgi:predicted DNA-binding transcriptional regulator AlpA